MRSSTEPMASSHTGVYGPKLQEYVSKKCRQGVPLGRQKDRWSACSHLAEALEVSTITIEKWLNDERRGNNDNIWKLIELGLETAPDETIRLLEEDLENHRQRFLAVLASHHTGVYAPNLPASPVEVVA